MKKAFRISLGLLCLILVMLTLMACNSNTVTEAAKREVPALDREGFPISVPEEINTIISIGPSNTEILVALGFLDAIIQADMFSFDVPGINADICTYDMMAPDFEHIISLAPDIVFVTGFTRAEGEDGLYSQIEAAGISVINITYANSINDIKEDIRFIGAVMDAESKAQALISELDAEINRIKEISSSIVDKKLVYFELSPAPWMWSFGTGTFLNEMMEIAGAVNIMAAYEGWTGLGDEVIFELNPDVILTSTNFIDDPIGEIKSRPGWENITAVQNDAVFYIDTNSSNRQTHNITRALREIAEAVYPDRFQ